MHPFLYETAPARVIFGTGTSAQLAAEVERLGARRAMVLSTKEQAGQAATIAADLKDRLACSFAGATMHTPVEVTEQALAQLRSCDADLIIAIGGGSTIGLGKALALRTDLPQIVVPTTYAGSEMTPILGETQDGVKTTQRTPKVLPEVVIYDISLSLTLPVRSSVTSGMNAIAHAVEALYAKDGNPVVSLMAEAGIAALASALPRICQQPSDVDARSDALYGAWLCGICLGTTAMALHHKLCHTLGGTFDLPHAETHTVILPHATAYNSVAAPEAMAAIRRALAVPDAARGLFDLAKRLGAPTALSEIGMKREDIARAADLATKNPYWNPRQIEASAIHDLLLRAWEGAVPLSGATIAT